MERKQEWEESRSALRKIVREIVEANSDTPTNRLFAYKFAASRYRGMWYIWNAGADNIIATIKPTDKRWIVRYRPTSVYRDTLEKLSEMERDNFPSFVTMPSTNLTIQRRRIRSNVGGAASNNMNSRRRERRQTRRQQEPVRARVRVAAPRLEWIAYDPSVVEAMQDYETYMRRMAMRRRPVRMGRRADGTLGIEVDRPSAEVAQFTERIDASQFFIDPDTTRAELEASPGNVVFHRYDTPVTDAIFFDEASEN